LFWFLSFWAYFVAPLFVGASKLHKTNSCGSYDCVCFGIHEQVGHKSIHWTPATKYQDCFDVFHLAWFSPLFKSIGDNIRKYYPDIGCKLTEGISPEYLLFGLFTYGMFHLSPVELAHVDFNDFGICMVIPLGSSFSGSYLCFNYLNVEYKMQPGDMIIFRSAKLLHSVTELISGLRMCLVLASQKIVIEQLQKGVIPQ
jgi:hypothetical protein